MLLDKSIDISFYYYQSYIILSHQILIRTLRSERGGGKVRAKAKLKLFPSREPLMILLDFAEEVLVTCIGDAQARPLILLRNLAKKEPNPSALIKYRNLRSKSIHLITKARDKFRQRLAVVERENIRKHGFIKERESSYEDSLKQNITALERFIRF